MGAPGNNLRSLTTSSVGTWSTLLYLGVIAVVVSTLLQPHAQRRVSAPTAAVVYSLERVFGAVASFVWRGERLAPIGFVGGALVIVAMVVSQRAGLAG